MCRAWSNIDQPAWKRVVLLSMGDPWCWPMYLTVSFTLFFVLNSDFFHKIVILLSAVVFGASLLQFSETEAPALDDHFSLRDIWLQVGKKKGGWLS